MADAVYEKVLDLAKRRGFLYPAYELYGGAAGFYDYGPLGAQLKALLEAKFRAQYLVQEGAAEISTPAITVEPVLKASGHVDHFSDVVVSCKRCGTGFRADHLWAEELPRLREKLTKSKAADPVKRGVGAILEGFVKDIKEHPSPDVSERIRTASISEDAAQPDGVATTSTAETPTIDVAGFRGQVVCPACSNPTFDASANFNLMFRTHIGPGTGKVGYLRPETAQAMFVDFPLLHRYFREQLPFAACQIGRAYRNEISPRQGLIRLREFNQMEVEAFFDPGTNPKRMTHPNWGRVKNTTLTLVPNADQQPVTLTAAAAVKQKVIYNPALAYHVALVQRLLVDVGIDPKRLRFRQHLKDEMAHYAKDCWDAEFHSDRFGWVECVGIAYRTDYDLGQHGKHSGKPLVALRRFAEPVTHETTRVVPLGAKLGPLFRRDAPRVAEALSGLGEANASAAADRPYLEVSLDGATLRVPREAYEVRRQTETVHGEPFVPHVVEPSYGEDRIIYAILEHAFLETAKEGEPYTVLRLRPDMAPFTVAVFPLMPKDGLDVLAKRVAARLRREGVRVLYDDVASIGRRYARADEVGTPFAVTVDHDSLKNQTVTLRERDTTAQTRVRIGALPRELRRRLAAKAAPASLVRPEAA